MRIEVAKSELLAAYGNKKLKVILIKNRRPIYRGGLPDTSMPCAPTIANRLYNLMRYPCWITQGFCGGGAVTEISTSVVIYPGIVVPVRSQMFFDCIGPSGHTREIPPALALLKGHSHSRLVVSAGLTATSSAVGTATFRKIAEDGFGSLPRAGSAGRSHSLIVVTPCVRTCDTSRVS